MFRGNQEEIELFKGDKSDCLFVINRSVTSRFDTVHFLFEESRLKDLPPSAPNWRLEFFLAKYTTCIATRHPTRLRLTCVNAWAIIGLQMRELKPVTSNLQTLCRGTCAWVVRAYNLPKIIITKHEEFGLPFVCAGIDVDLVGPPLKPYFKILIWAAVV
jgi:hypothetical protein